MNRWACAFGVVGAVAAALPSVASAVSSSASLSVGVTVVRSCSLDTQPADSSSSVQIACVAGTIPVIGDDDSSVVTPIRSSAPALVPAEPQAPPGADPNVRVAVVNF